LYQGETITFYDQFLKPASHTVENAKRQALASSISGDVKPIAFLMPLPIPSSKSRATKTGATTQSFKYAATTLIGRFYEDICHIPPVFTPFICVLGVRSVRRVLMLSHCIICARKVRTISSLEVG